MPSHPRIAHEWNETHTTWSHPLNSSRLGRSAPGLGGCSKWLSVKRPTAGLDLQRPVRHFFSQVLPAGYTTNDQRWQGWSNNAKQQATDKSGQQQPGSSRKHEEKLLSPLDCCQGVSRTQLMASFPMEIHTAHAEPIGAFIREGHHKPFRALACPIGPSCKLIHSKTPNKDHWGNATKNAFYHAGTEHSKWKKWGLF